MRKIQRSYTVDELKKAYLIEKLTVPQIAIKYKMAEHLVSKDLAKLKIGRSSKEVAIVTGTKKAINKEKLYQYYIIENHSEPETAEHFGIHERTLRRRLKEFGFKKSIKLQQEAVKRVQLQKYGGCFQQSQYYKENVVDRMVANVKQTCQQKYGVQWVSNIEEAKEKAIQTRLEKYGAPYYTQTVEYHHKSKRLYYYDGEMFDSSWELALWIYAKEHQEEIVRCPCSFEYCVDGKVHKYFPDFLYKGKYTEVKGNIYMGSDGILVDFNQSTPSTASKAKTECIHQNNVVLYDQQQMKPILNYVFKKYGRSFLKKFQIKKN